MITFEQAMGAMDAPEITSLTPGPLDEQDMVNLILQRSEIIRDQPRFNRYIKAWTQGEDGPLFELIDQIGIETLVRRAAAFIYLEFEELKPHLAKPQPKHIADIGCGYALFDLFLAKEFGTKLVLIDLETNDNRHFGFKSEGAAYSNLDQTRDFLTANGVSDDLIDLRNPEKDDLKDLQNLDYVFSFISCGFHYPWDTYKDFYQQAVAPEGRIILDLRAHKLADALPGISEIGFARILEKAANNSADRVMIAKQV